MQDLKAAVRKEQPMSDEIEINAQGGMGSKIPRYELLPARATKAVAQVITEGAAKYAVDNWRAVTIEEHLRHALGHIFAALEPIQQRAQPELDIRDELAHAACRALMALEVALQEGDLAEKVPKGLAQQADTANQMTPAGVVSWRGKDFSLEGLCPGSWVRVE